MSQIAYALYLAVTATGCGSHTYVSQPGTAQCWLGIVSNKNCAKLYKDNIAARRERHAHSALSTCSSLLLLLLPLLLGLLPLLLCW